MKLSNIVKVISFTILVLFCTAQAQRIKVQGSKFIVNDNPIFMLGANTPWNKWNDFGNNFDSTWWDTSFQAMHNHGMNNTRVWISCDGANASPAISSTGAISAPTQTFWNHLTTLFQIAQKNKIYLMLAPISFDHTKTGNTNATYWKAMYASASNRQTFVDNYIIPLVQKFGSNPYFWSIDVGNELDWVFENHGVDTNNVFDLVARVSIGVHANSEVLVTLGTGAGPKYLSPTFGVSRYSNAALQKLEAGAYLDFYDDHYYPWMRQSFGSPFENGPVAWQIDDKPCVIGEYAAKGDSNIYTPAQCLQKAYDLGWQGLMPWTSNGVDGNGGLSDFGSAFQTWSNANSSLVFPPDTINPGPFTITVTTPVGGTITVSPKSSQYNRGDTVKLIAVPSTGNELLKWTGDATGTNDTALIVMTRNMTVSATFVSSGELVKNGTFSEGATYWTLGQYEGGAATVSTTDNTYTVTITSGGTDLWHVQLVQAGLSLVSGSTYQLSFDVSATAERSIFVAVGEASGTYAKYLEKTDTIGTTKQTSAYEFTPTASTTNARVEFNIGNSTIGVTLDNISLKAKSTSTMRNIIGNTLIQKAFASFNAKNRTLQIRGISRHMQIEGLSASGRRVFIRNCGNANGIIAVPLSSNAPQMIIVRGMVDGKTLFSQKVICQK